jgi:hypothetical protein
MALVLGNTTASDQGRAVEGAVMKQPSPMVHYEEMRRQLHAVHATSGAAIEAFNKGDTRQLQIEVQLMSEAVTAFGEACSAFAKVGKASP